MKRVFTGGSRKISRLNSQIREQVDKIMHEQQEVLIGEANGADRAMQEYFAENSYPYVRIYCMADSPRNNAGNWQVEHISSERKKQDFLYFAEKDRRMCELADYGFMLWDGESKGTLNNIINLLESDKRTLVYFSPEKSFSQLKKMKDLFALLKKCDNIDFEVLDKTIKLHKRLRGKQIEFQLS